MEFDKSRVYSAANADELKVGSRVIVADTLKDLKNKVEMGGYVTKLLSIETDDVEYRFCIDGGLGDSMYALAYLVEEPVKLKWTDLKVGNVIRRGTQESMVISIDRAENTCCHILIGAYKDYSTDLFWIGNKELVEWEKIENGND